MMTPMMHVSHSPEDTQRFAREQALLLSKQGGGQPIVIALEGELGAGKTTFIQAFAEALGVREQVKSPTFVLMKQYSINNVANYHTLYHLDCYRLNGSADLMPLGGGDIIHRAGTIVLIEWAERVADILPRNHWVIHIDHVAEQERNITVSQHISD
jgi:tRNA threonylcarbamoyladenosine biosynthesis protein TsaE